jgi:CHAD domain-containing protein
MLPLQARAQLTHRSLVKLPLTTWFEIITSGHRCDHLAEQRKVGLSNQAGCFPQSHAQFGERTLAPLAAPMVLRLYLPSVSMLFVLGVATRKPWQLMDSSGLIRHQIVERKAHSTKQDHRLRKMTKVLRKQMEEFRKVSLPGEGQL